MEANLCKIKHALRYQVAQDPSSDLPPGKEAGEEDPSSYLDPLLYLAFQHVGTEGSKRARYVRMGHSRLWFLGRFVMELSLVEYFLVRYPREVTACIRERIFGSTNRKVLPRLIGGLGLDEALFRDADAKELKSEERLNVFRCV
jgi:dsRNA-specific ribonuclease